MTLPGTPVSTIDENLRLFAAACVASIALMSSRQYRRSNGMRSMSSLPASIFEKSRMSFSRVSKAVALLRIVCANWRCVGPSGVSSSSSVMPSTPFIGVRIS